MARGATGTTKSGKTGLKVRSATIGGSTVKNPQPVDRHVGAPVRMRRMMVGMSQDKLGDSCGVTFQQIQKYEKGTNRMGASRLHQIARVLDVPVEFFYEGAPSEAVGRCGQDLGLDQSVSGDRRRHAAGLELVKAFMGVKDQKVRRRVVDLARAISAASELEQSA